MSAEVFWTALALVLVIEGAMPFLSLTTRKQPALTW
jgi:uncharacterized protein YjeT (DUF2065 family)